MIKIILMRHGEPVLAQTGRITPTEMERWIKLYNFAEVKADSAPIASLQWANSTTCIVASTAPRALSSVQALGHTASVVDAVFCEAQLPVCSMAVSSAIAFRLGCILPTVLVFWLLTRFRVNSGHENPRQGRCPETYFSC